MYATHTDLKSRMKRFFDELYHDPDLDAVNTDLADEDIDAAAAEINGAIGTRYNTPVTASGALPLLKSWTLTLAEELAYSRDDALEIPGNVEKRVKRVRDLLEKVLQGKFNLAADAVQNTDQAEAMIVDCDEPVFTRETMQGF